MLISVKTFSDKTFSQILMKTLVLKKKNLENFLLQMTHS